METRNAVATLGRIGRPEHFKTLIERPWDAIVVGAGHNGLACAAYLARARKSVLVLEARDRVGGACTLDAPWPGYRISPCAYLAGLLHPLVTDELGLVARGLVWFPATAGMFVPFEDGSSVQLWNDDDACEAEIRTFSPASVAGWKAMSAVKRRLREALRPDGPGDVWIGRAPSRADVEWLLQGDREAQSLLFDWSMAEFVEKYLPDERLQLAYMGQGVIGTNASPFEKGTASIHFHHASGRMFGQSGTWGYVQGGMGMVSFYLCDAARESGAVICAGTPVARILPGEGVELEGGERVRSAVVVSNADPIVNLRLLGGAADSAWRARIEATPIRGTTMKVNVALEELPNFMARPGTNEPHHKGQVNTPLSKADWRAAFDAAQAGDLPPRLWTELYFHTAHDPSVAPPGKHVMSVFAQYVPNTFREGSWETRREEAGDVALASIARFASNIPAVVLHRQVLGPPDIEREVGLTGGHIFQGEILPQFMWENRLAARTPMPGFFLCGACTYPGGSVIGINGRNAAMEVLAEKK